MRTHLFSLLALALVLAILSILSPIVPRAASAAPPPPSRPSIPAADCPPGGRCPLAAKEGIHQTGDGLYYADESALETGAKSPLRKGGPDKFGYTWDDTVPFNWIDATGGTDTNLNGYGQDLATLVMMPFPFKYYEQTESYVWIAGPGYVVFGNNSNSWPTQSWPIPRATPPNNVIAPWWTPTYMNTSGPRGRVFYKSGGVSPNRYFVIEWNAVRGGGSNDPTGGDERYTFELVLHENGDFDFEYKTMSYQGSFWCGSAGIEDSQGLLGLSYPSWCNRAPSSKAVHFTRPAESARMLVNPGVQGKFTIAGNYQEFRVAIRNDGTLGADIFDVSVNSAWTVLLFEDGGVTPLSDSNADGIVDTGVLGQGQSTVILARVLTPPGVVLGESNAAVLTLTSSVNKSVSRTAILQMALPSSFATTFMDETDGWGTLYRVQPTSQDFTPINPWKYYPDENPILHLPNGNLLYVWTRHRCLTKACYLDTVEIEYAIITPAGNTIAIGKVTDHSKEIYPTYDYEPAVAVTPNGKIGVVWVQDVYKPINGRDNFNVMFEELNLSGAKVLGPRKLTNNTTFGNSSTLAVPFFDWPHIAASADNRFGITWWREVKQSAGYLDDVFYGVVNTAGVVVKAATNLTRDTAGPAQAFYSPTITTVAGNKFLLAYDKYGTTGDIYYAVLSSSGSIAKGKTNLTGSNPSIWNWGYIDAEQLSSGKILIAWAVYANPPRMRFSIMDSSFSVTTAPTMLDNPLNPAGDYEVSVTADAIGHAVLTWVDYSDRVHLWYALVNDDGAVTTPPIAYLTAKSPFMAIYSNYYGYRSTSYP